MGVRRLLLFLLYLLCCCCGRSSFSSSSPSSFSSSSSSFFFFCCCCCCFCFSFCLFVFLSPYHIFFLTFCLFSLFWLFVCLFVCLFCFVLFLFFLVQTIGARGKKITRSPSRLSSCTHSQRTAMFRTRLKWAFAVQWATVRTRLKGWDRLDR